MFVFSGLYEPVLDESDDFYEPIGPNDLDQESNLQQRGVVHFDYKESNDKSKPTPEYALIAPSKPYRPFSAGPLEETVILSLSYKHVFPELNVEVLPPEVKYKLPVSDQYDPEGKRIAKLQGAYDKNIFVDVEKTSKFVKHRENVVQYKGDTFKKDVSDNSVFRTTAISQGEYKDFGIPKEEIDLDKIEQTASYVVDDSIDKAVSVAKQIKTKLGGRLSESLEVKENKDSSKLSKQSIRKEIWSNIKEANSKVISKEVNVAKEVKKFQTLDIKTDSRLNAEERKLLTRQDIEEAIEAGTVRERTEMFKRGTNRIMLDKLDGKITSDVKTSNIELSGQRVYNIGLQIISKIRQAAQTSQQSSLMLKKFLMLLTKVMITLYRFIPVETKYVFFKAKNFHEQIEEKEHNMFEDYVHKIDFNNEAFKTGSGLIKKAKLSGAKIAQIQGLKPAELTNKMNIVISEFLRKSGKEESVREVREFSRSRSRSKSESRIEEEILNDSAFNQKTIHDEKKLYEETYETKIQSLEIREMKTEKHLMESKTSRFESTQESHGQESKNDNNLFYIAIVEAHVYTNKNAIFEEQMRHLSESINESEKIESSTIYYKCEVSVTYKDFRESSLPPTVIIESIEEIPSEEVFEEKHQDISQTSSTGFEEVAKKLAVQKITEAIEPMLKIKEVKSVNIKNASPAIEMPLKSITETATVTMEKEKNILHSQKLFSEKSFVTIEKPVMSAVEVSEVSTEEEEEKVGIIDIPHVMKVSAEVVKVRVGEINATEIFEVIPEERLQEEVVQFEIKRKQSEVVLDKPSMFVPETTITSIEESFEQLCVSSSLSKEAKLDINPNIVAEITEVYPIETEQSTFDVLNVVAKEPEAVEEETILTVGETSTILSFEPKTEPFEINKIINQQAYMTIEQSKATETTVIQAEELKQTITEELEFTEKRPQSFIEQNYRTAAETLFIIPEEPQISIKTNENLNQQAHIGFVEHKATSVTSICLEEPKEEILKTHKLYDIQPNTNIKMSILNVAENLTIVPEEPNYGHLEISTFDLKRPQTVIENCGFIVAETLVISPNSPESENFEISEKIDEHVNTRFEESKATITSSVHVEEAKKEHLELSQVKKKQLQVSLHDSLLAVAATSETLSEEPKNENLITAQSIQEKVDVNIEEFRAATTTVVSFQEPKYEKLEIPPTIEKQPQSLIENPILIVAETVTILPEGPLCDNFNTGTVTGERANIIFDERKPLIISTIIPDEYQEKEIVIPKIEEKHTKALTEQHFLTVVETSALVPEESNIETYEITKIADEQAKLNIEAFETVETTEIIVGEAKEEDLKLIRHEEKKPLMLLESCNLIVPETLEIMPDEAKSDSFTAVSATNENANVKIGEFIGTTTTVVYVEEAKEENLNLPLLKAKQHQSSIEGVYLSAAETLLIIPEESRATFDVTRTTNQQVKFELIEQKATEVTLVFPLEAQCKVFEILETVKLTPQFLIQDSVLTVAENLTVCSEEKLEEFLEIAKTVGQRPVVDLEGLRVAEKILFFLEEPQQDFVEVNQVVTKESQPAVVDKYLAVAEIIIVLPLESNYEIFNIPISAKQRAQVQFEELKAVEASIICVEEFLSEEFIASGISTKVSDHFIEKSVKTVAVVTVVHINDMETAFSAPSQSVSKEVKISFETKTPLAQSSIILLEGTADYESKISKLASNQGKSMIVETSAVDVANIASATVINEETLSTEMVEVIKDDLSISSSSSISSPPSTPLIEEYVFGVMGHEYRVQSPQETSFDIKKMFKDSTYEVQNLDTTYTLAIEAALAEHREEKQSAALKVTKQETVEVIKDDMSISSSSSISSAPSTPLIEEYVFGVMGHEYRVQSPQETSLDIKKTYKDYSYDVQNLDTSYTLAIEAAIEIGDDMKIIEEEVSNVDIRKSQFWISDIKTLELLESSDANIQLIRMNVDAKANKASSQSKYLLAQNLKENSALTSKSRAQSFDQSADFDVSLQSLDLETKTSQQEVAMFDFKSRASFKSSEDVQSEANINIKSKEAKSFDTQSVDVVYGLTMENGTATMHEQYEESDVQTSHKSKIIKSNKRRVKKASKVMSLEASESDTTLAAGYSDYDAEKMEAKQSRSISKGSSSVFETSSITAMGENIESSTDSKATRVNLQSNGTSQASFSSEMQANLESTGSSSLVEKSSRSIEIDAHQSVSLHAALTGIKTQLADKEMDARQQLSLQLGLTDDKTGAAIDGAISSSPETPSTPLTDEYMFRLREPLPVEGPFVPRDCSFTPESIHEDPLVIVNGMIPHIRTKIVRILYSPPLQTPPAAAERKEPFFTKPGLKGGAQMHQFTKEEILEIERDSALLASAIDRTIRSIEEYKESVGIGDKKDTADEERYLEPRAINADQLTESSLADERVKDISKSKVCDNLEAAGLADGEITAGIPEESIGGSNSNTRNKYLNKLPRKSIQFLSRFTQI